MAALAGNERGILYDALLDHLVVVSMNHNARAWFWAHAEKRRLAGLSTYYVNATQVAPASAKGLDLGFALVPLALAGESKSIRAVVPGDRQPPYDNWGPEGRLTFTIRWPNGVVALT